MRITNEDYEINSYRGGIDFESTFPRISFVIRCLIVFNSHSFLSVLLS